MTKLTFDNYQTAALKTAIYPAEAALEYLTLGLVGEAGEVAEKVKKIIRDKGGYLSAEDRRELSKELGDTLWYTAVLLDYLGVYMGDAAQGNLDKLADRQARNKLKGNGDNR